MSYFHLINLQNLREILFHRAENLFRRGSPLRQLDLGRVVAELRRLEKERNLYVSFAQMEEKFGLSSVFRKARIQKSLKIDQVLTLLEK